MILERLDNLDFNFVVTLDWRKILDYNIKMLKNKKKEFSEDLLSNDDFSYGKNGKFADMDIAKNHLEYIFKKQITPIVVKVMSEFDGYRIIEEYQTNKSAKKSKGIVSYAYYYHIGKEVGFDNISEDVKKILSLFIIRFANHLSKLEVRDLWNLAIIQKMHIKIPNSTKVDIVNYVRDIFKLHTEFLNFVKNNPNKSFASLDDFGKDYTDRLKELQLQGDFSDEPNLNTFFRED